MLSDRNKRRKDKPNEANCQTMFSEFHIFSYSVTNVNLSGPFFSAIHPGITFVITNFNRTSQY